MLVQLEKSGEVSAAYMVLDSGPYWCSECKYHFKPGVDYYQRRTVYHPMSGKPAVMSVCAACSPYKMLQQPSEPIPVDALPTQELAVIRESTPPPVGWERNYTPGDPVRVVNTQNIKTDYRLKAVLDRMFTR